MPPARISDSDLLDRLTRVFQDHGYEGASLSRISRATGLERASLYHRFPGGKQQMAEAVLAHVGAIFVEHVLAPLREEGPLSVRVQETAQRIAAFYEWGERSCVLDTLSLADGGENLRRMVGGAYAAWRDAFALASGEAGFDREEAVRRASAAIAGIHGALVQARATGDRTGFRRAVEQIQALLTNSSSQAVG